MFFVCVLSSFSSFALFSTTAGDFSLVAMVTAVSLTVAIVTSAAEGGKTEIDGEVFEVAREMVQAEGIEGGKQLFFVALISERE